MRLKINTDGGSRGNPGPAAAGVVIADEAGRTLLGRGFYLGKTTSNVAEYEGLLRALQQAQRLGGSELEIFCDSELVVRQVNGQYRVKKAHLKNYHDDVTARMSQFKKVTLRHVGRADNLRADELVNRALNAGRDVEEQAVAAPSFDRGKPILAAVNIKENLQFRPAAPYREPLSRQGGVLSELICLAAQQHCQVKTIGSQTTLTVMRGGGAVAVGSERIPVEAGGFLHLNRIPSFEIAADGDEELVVIVTQIP